MDGWDKTEKGAYKLFVFSLFARFVSIFMHFLNCRSIYWFYGEFPARYGRISEERYVVQSVPIYISRGFYDMRGREGGGLPYYTLNPQNIVNYHFLGSKQEQIFKRTYFRWRKPEMWGKGGSSLPHGGYWNENDCIIIFMNKMKFTKQNA